MVTPKDSTHRCLTCFLARAGLDSIARIVFIGLRPSEDNQYAVVISVTFIDIARLRPTMDLFEMPKE
jgi:hypothetical protein